MSDSGATGEALLARETAPPWDLFSPRFPIVRRGYDRDAVDEYIVELEQDLADLRSGRAASTDVAAEIEKLGEQTAAILRVAHAQADLTARRAEAEAERCLSAAAANAVAMTDEAQAQLRRLDGETDVIWRERERLLEDVRTVATALFTLAEEALERFPGEQERLLAHQAPVIEDAPAPDPEPPQPIAADSDLQPTEAISMESILAESDGSDPMDVAPESDASSSVPSEPAESEPREPPG